MGTLHPDTGWFVIFKLPEYKKVMQIQTPKYCIFRMAFSQTDPNQKLPNLTCPRILL